MRNAICAELLSQPTTGELPVHWGWKGGDSTLQVHRMPRNVAGPKLAIAAVIPDAQPLSTVFVDTFFLAPSLKKKVAFSACILYIDALSKAIHLEPCALGQSDRPFSSQSLAGLKAFIKKGSN